MNDGELSRPTRGLHRDGAGRVARFGALVVLALAQPAAASSRIDCAISGACCFPRKGPSPQLASAPREAKLASIVLVEGPRGRPEIRRVLGERTAALGACNASTKKLRLVITPAGTVHVDGAGCLADALRATRFPVAAGLMVVDVSIEAPR